MDATHETFPQAVLDALTDHLAVVDADGVIRAVNAAWQRFARDNAAPLLIASGVGLNYLEVCRGAADRGDATAREVLAGLQAVLAGDCPEFAHEYPCHAPTEERWFRVRATPLQSPHRGVVVAHTNITPRKLAEGKTVALTDELAAHLQSLIRLHEVSTRFVRNGDAPEFLEQVLETAMAVTGADFGNIQLLDPQRGTLAIAAQRGFSSDFLTFFSHVEAGHATCGTAMAHKARVIVEDVATDPIFEDSPARDVMLAAGARAVQATPLLTRAGTVLGVLSTHVRTPHRPSDDALRLVDLCARQAADLIEQKRIEAQLTASLREKEVLLKEIHHRVKNNLQVVASLLYLQSDSLDDPQLLAHFQESQHRIRSMALIHETLYQARDLAHIDFAQYVQALTAYLKQAYAVDEARITLHAHTQEVWLDIDAAVPCGLILNELVSNALKHAFPDGRPGEIHIDLRSESGRSTLRVRDTGVGVPDGLDVRQAESLGWQLVWMLTEQLGGTLDLSRAEGTTVTLTFPLPKDASTHP